MKNAVKSFGDGGIIEGGSHASGNDVPILGGKYRVEGGEAISPLDSTQNNYAALELISTKGRKKRLTAAYFAEISTIQVRPATSSGTYGARGILGVGSGAGVGASQAVIATDNLTA